jgi:hypothetical protein
MNPTLNLLRLRSANIPDPNFLVRGFMGHGVGLRPLEVSPKRPYNRPVGTSKSAEYNRKAQAKWRAGHLELARHRSREATARARAKIKLKIVVDTY